MEESIQKATANPDFEGVSFDVRWKPFELDSNLPREGVDKMVSYNAKFGEERVAAMIPHMKKVGEEHGIRFSYGGKIGNTFDSHRLIWKAYREGGAGPQDALVENLFKAYFENEKNLGDVDVLSRCARDSGVSALPDENEGKKETLREMAEYRTKYGVRGVPFFIIDGKHTLSGAQNSETFTDIFATLISS